MPYIVKQSRTDIDNAINFLYDTLVGAERCTDIHPGLLNYAISKLLHMQIEGVDGPNYRLLNEQVGVLDCIKLELYRQVAARYEDKKKRENGPVSQLDDTRRYDESQ